MHKTLFTNATIATLDGPSGYALMTAAALLVEGEKIEWIGSMSDCPDMAGTRVEVIDCQGRLITPGLIDCHTHIVYGGDRADEFEMRLEGASYEEIAKKGGGIISTVNATRAASEDELYKQALPRLNQLLAEGVTTLEIKSGYGLDNDNEIKMLRVAQKLEDSHQIKIQKTFLAAHALPPEFKGRSDEYIELVCDEMLPNALAEGLVDAVDVFIEGIGFSVEQGIKVFDTAESLGLPFKAHVEQLSDLGGGVIAAELGALSIDHLEYVNPDDLVKIAQSDCVAVLLPGAFYVLRETQLPPMDALRKNNIAMAISTDSNPGSSPINSILLIMNMACSLFRLTPSEALRGVTINAAKALGLDEKLGSLKVGKQADIVIWDIDKPSMLSYQIGLNPCAAVMQAGVWRKPLIQEVDDD